MRHEIKEITIAKDANPAVSSGFKYEYWAIFVGIEIPEMDNGILYMDMQDASGTYHPILDPRDGEDAIICGSSYDPGFIDVTDWLRFVPPTRNVRVRCSAVQTTAAITLYVFLRG